MRARGDWLKHMPLGIPQMRQAKEELQIEQAGVLTRRDSRPKKTNVPA